PYPYFHDRRDAGRQLADELSQREVGEAVVFAVPRGGVPVAAEVAERLDVPLDVMVTRKIQIPFNPEAGYGAVTEDGALVLNEPLLQQLGLSDQEVQRQAERVQAEIRRRAALYRGVLGDADVTERTAILIDDGLASGFTMLAAIKSARDRQAKRVVVAVPVASERAYGLVSSDADEVVCPVISRAPVFAVASFYGQWYDLDDEEVVDRLREWKTRASGRAHRRGT
ncbi:MAG: phosphoribosyltransferase, partial [Chloroflexota bacterium]